MDGLEAIVVVMGVEQRQLLGAVNGIVGVVDIENDAAGTRLKLAQNRSIIDSAHAPEPRHDGAFSRRDRVGWLIRSSPDSDRRPQASLNAGSKRRTSRSCAILIPAGNSEQARPDHVYVSVGRARRVAHVGDAGSEHVGDAEPPVDLAQQQHPAVRRQPSAVEAGAKRLASNGCPSRLGDNLVSLSRGMILLPTCSDGHTAFQQVNLRRKPAFRPIGSGVNKAGSQRFYVENPEYRCACRFRVWLG